MKEYFIDRKKVADKIKSTLIKNIRDDVENKEEIIDHINNDWYSIDDVIEAIYDAYYNNNSKFEYTYYFKNDTVLKDNLYGKTGWVLDLWNFEDVGEFREGKE